METIKPTFAAYKVSLDGQQRHYDHVRGLTMEQARDAARFPLGKHKDAHGFY